MVGEGWKHGTQRIFHGSETSLCDAITMGLCHCVAVQLPSYVWLFATPWTAAHQASLPFTTTWNLLKFMSIESVMISNHLILCHSLSSHLQSFSASGSFPMSQLFASGSQSIGASASVSCACGPGDGEAAPPALSSGHTWRPAAAAPPGTPSTLTDELSFPSLEAAAFPEWKYFERSKLSKISL